MVPIPVLPEEHVQWRNDQEIEFKVILRDMNNEKMRYLVLSYKERALFFLRPSNRVIEFYCKFTRIDKIERDLLDHR